MSLVFASLLVAASAAAPACTWDRPGHRPFMGDVVAAVDRYTDIPGPVRERLKSRMGRRAYDEIVSIRRDALVGKASYDADIRDMHFANGQVCRTVSRAGWTDAMQERGLVYCESGHCILVPTVCRNVSRIVRRSPAPAMAARGGGAGTPGGAGVPVIEVSPAGGVQNDPAVVAAAPAAPPPVVPAVEAPTSFIGQTAAPTVPSVVAAVADPAPWWPMVSAVPTLGGGFGDPGTGVRPLAVDPVTPPSPVPEPRAEWLLALGLVVLVVRRRWMLRRD